MTDEKPAKDKGTKLPSDSLDYEKIKPEGTG